MYATYLPCAAGFGAEFPCEKKNTVGKSQVIQRCLVAMHVSDDYENVRIPVAHLLVP